MLLATGLLATGLRLAGMSVYGEYNLSLALYVPPLKTSSCLPAAWLMH
jgi:hypothetical protein